MYQVVLKQFQLKVNKKKSFKPKILLVQIVIRYIQFHDSSYKNNDKRITMSFTLSFRQILLNHGCQN